MISIIIPTINESATIQGLVQSLLLHARNEVEVLVCDAGSTDNTPELAMLAGAKVIMSKIRGRAAQMNDGALAAQGDILYFVHADVKVHSDYETDIYQAVREGFDLGCYRYQFNSKHLLLKINAFFTRFDRIWCRGGDQTLFITRACFDALNGFRSDFSIMEDYDLILRARQCYSFKIIPKNVIVSARKYETNSYLRVQWANLTMMRMWKKGVSQSEMTDTYRKLLDYR